MAWGLQASVLIHDVNPSQLSGAVVARSIILDARRDTVTHRATNIAMCLRVLRSHSHVSTRILRDTLVSQV